MTGEGISEAYHSEHLILLVGGNPLPNAVAGKLLLAQGGTISLVHSQGTTDVAQRLESWLKSQGTAGRIVKRQVEEGDPLSIRRGVQGRLNRESAETVGINYTGGTKAMSVHAYQAVKAWAEEHGVPTVSSYLDAHTLRLVIETHEGQTWLRPYAGRAVELTPQDLLALHGWRLQGEPVTQAICPQSARCLARTLADHETARLWQAWIAKLDQHGRKPNGEWKNDELREQPLAWDDWTGYEPLQAFVESFGRETGSAGSGQMDFAAPKDNGLFKKTKHIPEWLHGKWLEHDVLAILTGLAPELGLHSNAQNIETQPVQFDMDVISMRGYQLFAFSCTTVVRKSLLKSKLFEAYVRARQIGGDEARVALISASADPDKLQEEMRRDFDREGRIRVFGRRHLARLPEEIRAWIRTQSKEFS